MRPWIKPQIPGAVVPHDLIEWTVAAAMCCHDRRRGRRSAPRSRKSPGSGQARLARDLSLGSSGLLLLMPGPPDREVTSGASGPESVWEGDDMCADESEPERPSPIQELLARIKNGDEGAARELLARYEPKVRLVVRRQLPKLLRSRFDSLDFLQSVWGSFFYRVRTGPNDLDEEQNLVTFLAWAARNKVIDEYRRAATLRQDIKREEPLDRVTEKDDCLAAGDTPSQLAQANETYDRLRELLPEEQRVILEMKAEGHSSREIGDRLGVSERTVQRVLEGLKSRARLGDRP